MKNEAHPIWDKWSGFIIRHPKSLIFACMFVVGIMAIVVALTPADLSFTGMLDENDPEIRAFREQIEVFGSDTMLLLLLEGEPDALTKAVTVISEQLPLRAPLDTLNPPADPQWLIDRAPWAWPDPLFNAVMLDVEAGVATEPKLKLVETADRFIDNTFRPTDTAALIAMGLRGGPLDMAMGGEDYTKIVRATNEILEEMGSDVTASFAGIAATGAEDQRAVFTRIKVVTPLTLVAVLFLLMGVETRMSRVAMAGIALGGSVLISFGMVGLVLGRLSIIVTFFGMLLLGLGIDFGIHLLVALRDGRAQGMSPVEAVKFAIGHTGLAIALGGVSTGLAFGVVALAPEPGARDMGLSAFFGLTGAFILMLSFLPAAWLLLERRHEKADPPVRFTLPGLRALVSLSIKFPKTVLIVGLALTLFGITGIPRYSVETDLKKIISRGIPSFEVEQRLQEIYGVAPIVYVAPVDSLAQAREWTKELKKLPDIATVTSAADLVMENSEAREERMQHVLDTYSDESNPLLARIRTAMERGPITVDTIPPSMRSGAIGKGDRLAVQITPKVSTLDAKELEVQIQEIRAVAPTATGVPVFVKMAITGRRDYVPIMIPAILVVVTIVLIVAFRNMRDVLLGLLPVIVGTAATFGVFLWFNFQFTVLTSIVVPVILGLGVDDGIHVMERLRRYRVRSDEHIHEAVESVGRGIFLTTSTTSVSFLGLLLTNHAGMESIAYFMLMGVPMCFITSVTMIPAAVKLLERRSE